MDRPSGSWGGAIKRNVLPLAQPVKKQVEQLPDRGYQRPPTSQTVWFLDLELISYGYSILISFLLYLFLLEQPLQKKTKAPSFQTGLGWNLAGMNVLQVNMHWLTKSDFRFDVTLSRRWPWRNLMKQSAATWWVNMERPPAYMQQRPSVSDQ